MGQKSFYANAFHWLVVDLTRERNFTADCAQRAKRIRAALQEGKGLKTMTLMSSPCLGLVPPGPKQQQTQLAFFVLIELEGSQGSLYDCKSGKCE